MSIRRRSTASLLPMFGVAGRDPAPTIPEGVMPTRTVIERTRDAEGIDWSHCPAVCRADEQFVKLAVELKRAENDKSGADYLARIKQRLRERWNDLTGVGNA